MSSLVMHPRSRFSAFLTYVSVIISVGCGGVPSSSSGLQNVDTPQPEWIADELSEVPNEVLNTATGLQHRDQNNVVDVIPVGSESTNHEHAAEIPIQKIYRPDDTRMQLDDKRLHALGIMKYVSNRLILYTDIAPEIAVTLPPLVDLAYATLVDYFGEPPPARSGAEFQFTGYLIKDRELFLAAGLIPDDLIQFDHGQHRGQEFWMYDQNYDYYRKHLLIHEVTHCFMMILPGLHPPLWYLEGMAELFATHQEQMDGPAQFAVMPEEAGSFTGFGRIEMIQEEIAAGRLLNIDQAAALGDLEFSRSRSVPYAWTWALCKFLDTHPRYQARFRELSNHLVGAEFSRLSRSLFAGDKLLLAAEWEQFVQRCDYGWDFAANAFVMKNEQPSPISDSVVVAVSAERGWQSSGLFVEAGNEYSVSATGTVSLANLPKSWISEPQGISIRYTNGIPIGRLEAGVLVSAASSNKPLQSAFMVHDCGREKVIHIEKSGLLMFQVNDFGNERRDNRGEYQVQIAIQKP